MTGIAPHREWRTVGADLSAVGVLIDWFS